VSPWYAENLAALTSLSPRTAALMEQAAQDGGISGTTAQTGDPILEWDGRALDSRRNPRAAAQSAAADVDAEAVVLLGCGSAYVADALEARGVTVAAIVERGAVLAAGLHSRDLRGLLRRVPVVALETLQDAADVARLRARADRVFVHAPSVALSPELAALAARWPQLPAARQPRVLVVGPIDGGSLGIAHAVARALERAGVALTLFDASPFAPGQDALGQLPLPELVRRTLQGHQALLLGDAVVELARETRADLVLALAQAPLAAPALDRLRAIGVPSAFWFVENTRVLPYWRDIVGYYDCVYAIQDGPVLDQMRAHGAPQAAYLPMACDPHVHQAVALTTADRDRYGSALSFAGAPYLNRRHVLAGLCDLGLKVWGEGWETTALAGHLGAVGRFDRETMMRVFCASTINLNLHSAEHVTGLDPLPDYVNPRTFELAACGAFQLVDARTPLAAVFAADEVAVFHDVAELRRLAGHYLEHPQERAAMAARAQRRALAEHTYDHRVVQICRDMLAPSLQPDAHAPHVQTLGEALSREREHPELTETEAYLRMLDDVGTTGVPR
jgi:spore maturation protein CgeB